MFGSKIFLIATGVPLRRPLWITEKPPWPIYSLISKSVMLISRTPGTAGRRPDVVETSPWPCVKEAKLAFVISLRSESTSSCSRF